MASDEARVLRPTGPAPVDFGFGNYTKPQSLIPNSPHPSAAEGGRRVGRVGRCAASAVVVKPVFRRHRAGGAVNGKVVYRPVLAEILTRLISC